MVIDYSERRQKRANVPPRRPSVWPYVLIIALLMILSFAAGGATGWYLYRPGGRFYKAPAPPLPEADTRGAAAKHQAEQVDPAQSGPSREQAPANPPQSQIPQEKTVSAPPPLTFYNTLQKGNKGLMGTGINQPKEGQPQPPSAAPKPASPQLPER